MRILECGCAEPFKRRYHGAIAWLLVGAALYNALAWCQRREPHLLLMTGLTVVGALGEGYVCQQHRRPR